MSHQVEAIAARRARTQQNKDIAFDVAVPAATRTYGPVANKHLYYTVKERVRTHGLNIIDESVELSQKDQVMLVKFQIADPSDTEMTRTLAFLNSYNKSRKVSFASGATVAVCSNGMFIGEESFAKRHHTQIWTEIQENVDKQVEIMEHKFRELQRIREWFKKIPVTPQAASHLSGELYFKDMIGPRMLSEVKQGMRTDENWGWMVDEHGALQPEDLWRFYNNVTEALKRAPAHESIQTNAKVTSYLCNKFNFPMN